MVVESHNTPEDSSVVPQTAAEKETGARFAPCYDRIRACA